MKIRFLEYTSMATIAFLMVIGSACSDDDKGALRKPKDGNNNEIEYTWAATADSLQEATYNTYLYTEGTFKQDNVGNNNFNYWWNAHALDVLVDGYLRTGNETYVPRMKALVNGIKIKNGNKYENEFIDDMEWLGIACLNAYNATNDNEYLDLAKMLWGEVKKGWSDVHGGGITWKINTPNLKNACSNGPGAILAMHLYEIEENPEDLEWAEKIYAWEKATLVDPITGLVWDHIELVEGEVVINKDWIFSYNVGSYMGAAVALYAATKDQSYLNDAVKTAKSMMVSNNLITEGILKSEGQGDGGLFKGILIRYFTALIQEPDLSESARKDFVKFLKFNAETFFNKGISRPAMLCSPDWRHKPGANVDLSTQLTGVMLMEAVARLKEAEAL